MTQLPRTFAALEAIVTAIISTDKALYAREFVRVNAGNEPDVSINIEVTSIDFNDGVPPTAFADAAISAAEILQEGLNDHELIAQAIVQDRINKVAKLLMDLQKTMVDELVEASR